MNDNIRLVDYYYLEVPDKPGEALKPLARLKEAGVNMRLVYGFPEGRHAQLDLVPVDPAAFMRVAQANKWKVTGPKKAFWIQGPDRVGAAAEIMQKLAAANVNITASSSIVAGDQYGMVLWVHPRDVQKATTALGIA